MEKSTVVDSKTGKSKDSRFVLPESLYYFHMLSFEQAGVYYKQLILFSPLIWILIGNNIIL